MEVPVVARLRLPDGREFEYHTTVAQQYADNQASWWIDGNACCDCNRSLFLNREHALGLGVDSDNDCCGDPCLPCGDTIELLALSVDGVTVIPSVRKEP
jgi:hypothetical protein